MVKGATQNLVCTNLDAPALNLTTIAVDSDNLLEYGCRAHILEFYGENPTRVHITLTEEYNTQPRWKQHRDASKMVAQANPTEVTNSHRCESNGFNFRKRLD
jgi:hypothetical protein